MFQIIQRTLKRKARKLTIRADLYRVILKSIQPGVKKNVTNTCFAPTYLHNRREALIFKVNFALGSFFFFKRARPWHVIVIDIQEKVCNTLFDFFTFCRLTSSVSKATNKQQFYTGEDILQQHLHKYLITLLPKQQNIADLFYLWKM